MSSVQNASTQELIHELMQRTDADPRQAIELTEALLPNFAMVCVYSIPAESIKGTALKFAWDNEALRNEVIGNLTPLLLSAHDVKQSPFPE